MAKREPTLPLPYVRYMLLCDDVQFSSSSPRKVNVLGILSKIYVSGTPDDFPVGFGFKVYVVLTEGFNGIVLRREPLAVELR
jgi:hypothetical protein